MAENERGGGFFEWGNGWIWIILIIVIVILLFTPGIFGGIGCGRQDGGYYKE